MKEEGFGYLENGNSYGDMFGRSSIDKYQTPALPRLLASGVSQHCSLTSSYRYFVFLGKGF